MADEAGASSSRPRQSLVLWNNSPTSATWWSSRVEAERIRADPDLRQRSRYSADLAFLRLLALVGNSRLRLCCGLFADCS